MLVGCDCDGNGTDAKGDGDAGGDEVEPAADAMIEMDAGGAAPPDAMVMAADSGGDSSAVGMDGAIDSSTHETDGSEPHPVSEYCGDAIRDPELEECDDGPGDDDDLCTADCRVSNGFVVEAGLPEDAGVLGESERELGTGPHVAASGPDGFAVVYLERDARTVVRLQAFDRHGTRSGLELDVGVGTRPVAAANPVVAALPGGRYAVAWTEHGAGTPDIALRIVTPGTAPRGAVTYANAARGGPQQDADVLWTGDELVVAWSDSQDVRSRRFDASLAPLEEEQSLASSAALEGNITLARFASGWAAAWREGDLGFERVRVRAGNRSWFTQPFLPGPLGDRPGLVALDDEHLLLVHTVGTDPLGSGTANVGRLRVAVLRIGAPGGVTSQPWLPLHEPYASNVALAQRRPSATRVGDELFVTWEQESPRGDERSDEVLVQRLSWSADAPNVLVSLEERVLQNNAPSAGDQRNPKLAPTPLFPGGALITLWEDHSRELPTRPVPEIVLGLRPVPFVDLAPVVIDD